MRIYVWRKAWTLVGQEKFRPLRRLGCPVAHLRKPNLGAVNETFAHWSDEPKVHLSPYPPFFRDINITKIANLVIFIS
jgi:hypothetical protein